MSVRCLIVDDNHEFLRAASDLLERDGITVVGVATTGAQAQQASGELRPDVVLVDVQLGRENGFEVARQLAGKLGPASPSLILISANFGEDFGDMIPGTPAMSYLPKTALSATAVLRILARTGRPINGQ